MKKTIEQKWHKRPKKTLELHSDTKQRDPTTTIVSLTLLLRQHHDKHDTAMKSTRQQSIDTIRQTCGNGQNTMATHKEGQQKVQIRL